MFGRAAQVVRKWCCAVGDGGAGNRGKANRVDIYPILSYPNNKMFNCQYLANENKCVQRRKQGKISKEDVEEEEAHLSTITIRPGPSSPPIKNEHHLQHLTPSLCHLGI